MLKAFYEFLGICSKLNPKANILIGCINFFWIVTIKIQTRHTIDYVGKENTTISLMNWKIIMFDHEGAETAKVISSLSILFLHVKFENMVTKNIWG